MCRRAAVVALLLTLAAGAQLPSQQSPRNIESERPRRGESPEVKELRERYAAAVQRQAQLMSDEELRDAVAQMDAWVERRLGLLRIMEELQALIDAHPGTDTSERASAALKELKGSGPAREKLEQLLETRIRIRELRELSGMPEVPPDRPLDAEPGDEDLLNRIVAEWQLPQEPGSGGGSIQAAVGPTGSPKVSISYHNTAAEFSEVCNHYAKLCGIDRQFNGGQGIGSGKSDRGYYGWMGLTRAGKREAAFSLRSDRYTAAVWLLDGGETVWAQLAVVLPSRRGAGDHVGHPMGEAGRGQKYGHIEGQFVLDGEVPNLPPLVPKGANVKNACAAQNVPDESLVIDPATKGIANIFVYMRRRPSSIHPELKNAPKQPVVFDQKNCQFIPHAAFVRVGQKVLVKSSDPIPHNIHTHPILNHEDNFIVRPNDQQGVPLTYDKSEILPTKVNCDLHPHMTAYWLILDHPYAAITDEEGKFTIENLPEGEHTFRVWHERVGYLDREFNVTVQPNQTTALEQVKVAVEKPGSSRNVR